MIDALLADEERVWPGARSGGAPATSWQSRDYSCRRCVMARSPPSIPQHGEYRTSLDPALHRTSRSFIVMASVDGASRPKVDTAAAASAQPSSPTTPSTPRRRTAAHMASPTDIKPSTPGARRMSQSSTPQAAVTPESIFDKVLDRPVMVMAGVVSSIVLSVCSSATGISADLAMQDRYNVLADILDRAQHIDQLAPA